MKSYLVLFVVLSMLITKVYADDFSLPIKALEELRIAQSNKDIEGVLSKMDFLDAAKRIAKKFDLPLPKGQESLSEMARELRQEYESLMRKGGFPNYSGVKCVYTNKKRITSDCDPRSTF